MFTHLHHAPAAADRSYTVCNMRETAVLSNSLFSASHVYVLLLAVIASSMSQTAIHMNRTIEHYSDNSSEFTWCHVLYWEQHVYR